MIIRSSKSSVPITALHVESCLFVPCASSCPIRPHGWLNLPAKRLACFTVTDGGRLIRGNGRRCCSCGAAVIPLAHCLCRAFVFRRASMLRQAEGNPHDREVTPELHGYLCAGLHCIGVPGMKLLNWAHGTYLTAHVSPGGLTGCGHVAAADARFSLSFARILRFIRAQHLQGFPSALLRLFAV